MSNLYFRMHMKVDTANPEVQNGTISDWELVPATGFQGVVEASDIPYIEATLTSMVSTGVKSIQFDTDYFNVEYTFDPHAIGGDINGETPAPQEDVGDIFANLDAILADE